MQFCDEVVITVKAGDGGDGIVSFRREKYIPFGGPDGGAGALGGSVIIVSDNRILDLGYLKRKKKYLASKGGKGGSGNKTGCRGEDLLVRVPVGTEVRDHETNLLMCDLIEHGDKIIVAKGGLGGVGNTSFKSSVNRRPRRSEKGQEGEERIIKLVQKLCADAAIVGCPNAGKSTIFSLLTGAYSKTGDYAFTTQDAVLGKVKIDYESAIIADMPGLIDGASDGRGMGINFLKHIERSRLLLHFVDISSADFMKDFEKISEEMKKYDKSIIEKERFVILNKTDKLLPTEVSKAIESFNNYINNKDYKIAGIIDMSRDSKSKIEKIAKIVIEKTRKKRNIKVVLDTGY